MCKLCELKEASIIDNINADTSLKLANAAAAMMNAARNKEGDELAAAALSYWREPKDTMVKGETQGSEAQQSDHASESFARVALNTDGSYVTQGPVPTQGFHVDRDNGELYINGTYIGDLTEVNTLLGKFVALKMPKR